jgi:ATP-dependent DNA ligase
VHPVAGGKPIKVKPRQEHDVFIREVFPGGKYPGDAGGFRYSLDETGPIVGKVGSGLSDDTRKLLWEMIGRRARIAAQEQFPSGAYRAPSLLAIHEG